MHISKRLRAIGDLVEDNSFVLDVGCDHALLDIYIVDKYKNVKAIASDINKGPLKQAKENIKKYKLENKIILKQANGLNSYQKEIDTIVLSGLGSITIIGILKDKKEILKEIKNIIISSNNDYYYLRKQMIKLGFKPKQEIIIKDKNKYYPIIVFEKGYKFYNKYELKYGKLEQNNTYKEYLQQEKDKLINIRRKLDNKHILKQIKITKEIKYLNKKIRSKH